MILISKISYLRHFKKNQGTKGHLIPGPLVGYMPQVLSI